MWLSSHWEPFVVIPQHGRLTRNSFLNFVGDFTSELIINSRGIFPFSFIL